MYLHTILAGLERLNESFSGFSDYQLQQTDYGQAYHEDELAEESGDNPTIDIEQDLENITNHVVGATGSTPLDNDIESDVVDYGSQLDLNNDVKGAKINEKVSGVVNKLCLQRISQEQSKAMMKRHITPENIQVRLPKCEQSI